MHTRQRLSEQQQQLHVRKTTTLYNVRMVLRTPVKARYFRSCIFSVSSYAGKAIQSVCQTLARIGHISSLQVVHSFEFTSYDFIMRYRHFHNECTAFFAKLPLSHRHTTDTITDKRLLAGIPHANTQIPFVSINRRSERIHGKHTIYTGFSFCNTNDYTCRSTRLLLHCVARFKLFILNHYKVLGI